MLIPNCVLIRDDHVTLLCEYRPARVYQPMPTTTPSRSRIIIYRGLLYFFLSLSVAVSKRQVAIIARSTRGCLKLFVSTESTSSHKFASQFDLEFFGTRKTPKHITNTESPARLFTRMNQWRRPDGPTVITAAPDWAKTVKNNNSKREFKPSRQVAPKWQITQMSANIQKGHNDGLFLHGLKMWFRNYYVAHACVVFIKINNEELVINAVQFYFSSV